MAPAALALTLAATLGAHPVVLLSPEDRALILGPVIQSVQAQLSDLPVQLQVQPISRLGSLAAQMRVARQVSGTEGLAVVWFELTPGDPVFVYVADPQKNRVLVRSVDWDGALGHLEAAGLIVRSSVQALLAGKDIGFEAPAPPRPEPGPAAVPPPPPPVRRFHTGLEVAYAPSLISGDAPALHGVGVGLDAGWGEHLVVRLGYRLNAPFLLRESTWAVALVWSHPLSLSVGARLRLGRVRLGAELGGTAQIVSLEMKEVGPWVSLATPRDQVLFHLSPRLTASLALAPPLSLFLAVGADVPLGERRFLTDGPGGPGVALDTWPVQPHAGLGLRFDLL